MPTTHVPEVYDATLLSSYFRELRLRKGQEVK
jgi:hypothetical protein